MLRELAASISRSPSKVAIIMKLEEKEILTMTDLSKQLRKNKSTILRHIKSLEKANVVASKRAQTDHRVILLLLTQEGKEIAHLISDKTKVESL